MSVLTKSGSAVLRTSSRETLRHTQAEDLRQRLYNAKSRTIGVCPCAETARMDTGALRRLVCAVVFAASQIDKDALDRQVEELKARRAAEAAEEKAYGP
jgi:hypothetical protein